MRIFGSDKVKSMVDALGLEEDEPIQAKMLTNAIENAQKILKAETLILVSTFFNTTKL